MDPKVDNTLPVLLGAVETHNQIIQNLFLGLKEKYSDQPGIITDLDDALAILVSQQQSINLVKQGLPSTSHRPPAVIPTTRKTDQTTEIKKKIPSPFLQSFPVTEDIFLNDIISLVSLNDIGSLHSVSKNIARCLSSQQGISVFVQKVLEVWGECIYFESENPDMDPIKLHKFLRIEANRKKVEKRIMSPNLFGEKFFKDPWEKYEGQKFETIWTVYSTVVNPDYDGTRGYETMHITGHRDEIITSIDDELQIYDISSNSPVKKFSTTLGFPIGCLDINSTNQLIAICPPKTISNRASFSLLSYRNLNEKPAVGDNARHLDLYDKTFDIFQKRYQVFQRQYSGVHFIGDSKVLLTSLTYQVIADLENPKKFLEASTISFTGNQYGAARNPYCSHQILFQDLKKGSLLDMRTKQLVLHKEMGLSGNGKPVWASPNLVCLSGNAATTVVDLRKPSKEFLTFKHSDRSRLDNYDSIVSPNGKVLLSQQDDGYIHVTDMITSKTVSYESADKTPAYHIIRLYSGFQKSSFFALQDDDGDFRLEVMNEFGSKTRVRKRLGYLDYHSNDSCSIM